MAVIEIINKTPLTLSQVGESLQNIEKRDGELNFRAKKVQDYITNLKPVSTEEAEELTKKIQTLDIPRLKPQHITKLVDIRPKDMDTLKVLFSNENITLKQEDYDKLLQAVK